MSGILMLIMRWRTVAAIVAAISCLILGVLAVWLPAQEQIVLWRWVLPFSEKFEFFGRQLELSAGDRPILAVLYLTATLWFGAVPLARPTRLFMPLGMVVVALFTAAIAVEPFLFAAVFIEIAVLLSIPLLSPPGGPVSIGVLRYLTFQTLGLPFVLSAGFLFAGFEIGPGDPVFVALAIALLAIGFSLLLGVFPFHTWIPMLAEESHPYVTAFIFLLLPIAVLLLGVGFLDSYVWMKEDPNTVLLFQIIGIVMIIAAGGGAAIERNLSRLIGFAIILDIGFSLLAISLSISEDPVIFRRLFFAGLMPRGLSLGVIALAMSSLIGKVSSFNLNHLQGLLKRSPAISSSIVIALFCIAGLPLLAGFPFKMGIIEGLSSQAAALSFWAILGSLGLIVGIIRLLLSMVSDSTENDEKIQESRILVIFLLIGVGLLFLIGLLPELFLQYAINFPGAFIALG
jgi:NADH-quinone oxidoreductase subunit N